MRPERVSDSDERQLSIAAAVAAAAGIDAAKANAKDCIQVLGGIGITWEHDAHLYLRRAYGIAHFLGGAHQWLRRIATLTQQGVRRDLRIDLDSVEHLRPEIASAVAEVAAQPAEKRQIALADTGAAGTALAAARTAARPGPAEQLLIDQELAAADVVRPDLVSDGGRCRRSSSMAAPSRSSSSCPPRCAATSSGASCSASPAPVRTWRRCARRPCAPTGGWKLTGQKVWTSAAHKAAWGVCLARTDPDAPKHKGITYFLVDMKSPGIDIRPLREITGDNLFNEVFFDDVFVPDDMVVGPVNDGWRLARTTLANERVAMSHGTALGNPMEELLRTVADLDLDSTGQHQLGEMILAAQVGSLLDRKIAELAVGGQDPGPQASARKLIGVRYRQGLAELRMELSEGAGVVDNKTVFDFLNTRCLTIAGGTEQILLTMAGERLLGLPR